MLDLRFAIGSGGLRRFLDYRRSRPNPIGNRQSQIGNSPLLNHAQHRAKFGVSHDFGLRVRGVGLIIIAGRKAA